MVPGAAPENFELAKAGAPVPMATKASGIATATADNNTFLPVLIPIDVPPSALASNGHEPPRVSRTTCSVTHSQPKAKGRSASEPKGSFTRRLVRTTQGE